MSDVSAFAPATARQVMFDSNLTESGMRRAESRDRKPENALLRFAEGGSEAKRVPERCINGSDIRQPTQH
jgi:hypothetical protein